MSVKMNGVHLLELVFRPFESMFPGFGFELAQKPAHHLVGKNVPLLLF